MRERRRRLGDVAGWLSIASGVALACACASLSNPAVNLPLSAVVVIFSVGLLGALLSVVLSSWRWLVVLVPWVVLAGMVAYLLSKPLTAFL